jgi:hypothetical protein
MPCRAAASAVSSATDLAAVLEGKPTMTVQRVSVKGRVMCGANPSVSSETWVKLVSKRMGMDDSQEGRLASDGTFELTLTVDRWFTITPELWIYTTCAEETLGIPKGCVRLLKIKVPSKYVNSGQPYDTSTHNFETKILGEEQDCTGARVL